MREITTGEVFGSLLDIMKKAHEQLSTVPIPLPKGFRKKIDPGLSIKPITKEYHTLGPSGCNIVRKYPKRDKTISARQYKRKMKAQRRQAKSVPA